MQSWYAYRSHEDSSWQYGLAMVALESAIVSPGYFVLLLVLQRDFPNEG
jgi:hypothetical protein